MNAIRNLLTDDWSQTDSFTVHSNNSEDELVLNNKIWHLWRTPLTDSRSLKSSECSKSTTLVMNC